MASTSSNRFGITFKRRRSKKEIEERRKVVLLRRAGYRESAVELVCMLDEPGTSVNPRG